MNLYINKAEIKHRTNMYITTIPIILLISILYISNVEGVNDNQKDLKIIFIDVGQGNSILLIIPNGKSMLIDGGEREQASKILAKIREEGLNSIDVIIATHPHADHIGGLIDVMKNITVKQVLDSGQIHTTKTFEEYLDMIEAKNIPLNSVKQGDVIPLDTNVSIEVLNPASRVEISNADEFNNNSVVIKIGYNNFTAIFPADIERETEARLVEEHNNGRINLDVDVLLVPHQGSNTSSTSAFLHATSPEVAIISVGENNKYGHPHSEVMERLEAAGVKHVFRTDIDGSITLITNGQTYTIITDKTTKTITIPEFGIVLFIASISIIILIGITRGIRWRSSRQL